MKILIVLLFLFTLLPAPAVAQYRDNDAENAYNVVRILGTDKPIAGEARRVWRDSAMTISYRIKPTGLAFLVVRYEGVTIGRWARKVNSNEVYELYWVNCLCWWDLASTAGGL